jgi:hypothetical protein
VEASDFSDRLCPRHAFDASTSFYLLAVKQNTIASDRFMVIFDTKKRGIKKIQTPRLVRPDPSNRVPLY